MEQAVKLAYAAGVPMAIGADAYGPPGRELGSSADEPIALVRHGVRPARRAADGDLRRAPSCWAWATPSAGCGRAWPRT